MSKTIFRSFNNDVVTRAILWNLDMSTPDNAATVSRMIDWDFEPGVRENDYTPRARALFSTLAMELGHPTMQAKSEAPEVTRAKKEILTAMIHSYQATGKLPSDLTLKQQTIFVNGLKRLAQTGNAPAKLAA